MTVETEMSPPNLNNLFAVKPEEHDSKKQPPIALRTANKKVRILLRQNKSKSLSNKELYAVVLSTGSFDE